jgi:lipid-A-disaccharide synthase
VASSARPASASALTPSSEARVLRVAVVAGETSGDLLGGRVLRALKAAYPDCELHFEGIGGDTMLAEGMHGLYPMERLSVMGLVEPLGRLPELLRIRRELVRRWRAEPPAFFLGIDAPDFNLGLARRLKDAGIATVHLVSPTVWAWRPGRIHGVARAVDRLLCLFPFEPQLYASVDVDAVFVGHPLARELEAAPDRAAARRRLGLADDVKVIALLPGSRGGEVQHLAPTLIAAGLLLRGRDPRRVLLMPAASDERLQQCRSLLAELDPAAAVRLLQGQSREVMAAADVVLLASGTASLEAMLLRRPMVITYRVAPLSWAIMSRLVVTPYVGLPNVFAAREVAPEFLQDDLNPQAVALAAEGLLFDGDAQVEALEPYRHALAKDFDVAVGQALGDHLEPRR